MKTTSLALSKQLKLTGFPQESYFWWETSRTDKGELLTENRIPTTTETDKNPYISYKSPADWQYAAPTAEEILERLPGKHNELDMILNIVKIGNSWSIEYHNVSTQKVGPRIMDLSSDLTLAEAAGKMYLYLAENHLLKEDKTL